MKLLLILLFTLVIPLVIAEAECSKVVITNFNYNEGVVTYKDKVTKCGYTPDRKLQPIAGYTAEILSMDNNQLYSFKFQIPLKLNFDLSDPVLKSLSGGMLILNETDFALIFPYYDNAKSIIIYNQRDYEIATIPLIEEQFTQKRTFWWVLILAALLLVVGYVVYGHYKNKQSSTKNL